LGIQGTGLIALDEMNKLGAEGWELIAVQSPNIDNIGLYFKRRKNDGAFG